MLPCASKFNETREAKRLTCGFDALALREVGQRANAARAGASSLQIGPTFHLLPCCKVGCAAKVACKGKSTSRSRLCGIPPAALNALKTRSRPCGEL